MGMHARTHGKKNVFELFFLARLNGNANHAAQCAVESHYKPPETTVWLLGNRVQIIKDRCTAKDGAQLRACCLEVF